MKSASAPLDKKKLLKVYRQALMSGLSLNELEKKVAHFSDRKNAKEEFKLELEKKVEDRFWHRLPRIVRTIGASVPLLLMIFGVSLALSALWPILRQYLPQESGERVTLLSPLGENEEFPTTQFVYAQEEKNQADQSFTAEPVISSKGLDYTDLRNWFEDDNSLTATDAIVTFEEYSLDIPKLKVENALVRVGGTDLNKSLIQYPGTALPGQQGAPVLFGHSVLRQFYNPAEKNPKRYASIFSTIMTLKEGDDIFITHKNVRYHYRVSSKAEVKPSDTFILAQRYDSRQLKLVTCVPEGTTLKRGVITAELLK